MEEKMNEKRNRSDEPNLSLSLKTPIEYESVKRIPTLEEAMNLELKNGQVDPNVNLKKFRRYTHTSIFIDTTLKNVNF